MSRATKAPVLRRSRTDDLCAVRQLLSAAGLPIDDVGPRLLQHFLIAELDDEIIGLVGLQVYDSKGLLRSLVVALNYRNAGLGERLIRALESAAQAVGISALWLLTIDAEQFLRDMALTSSAGRQCLRRFARAQSLRNSVRTVRTG